MRSNDNSNDRHGLLFVGVGVGIAVLLTILFLAFSDESWLPALPGNDDAPAPSSTNASLVEIIANRRLRSVYRGEGDVWSFSGDGRFSYAVISDYSYGYEGDWRFVDLNGETGLLFLTFAMSNRVVNEASITIRHRVLFAEARGRDVYLDFQRYQVENDGEIVPIDDEIFINNEALKEAFLEYRLLVGVRWIKANEINTDFIPHELVFAENGTVTAKYNRTPPCGFTGRWSMTGLGDGRVEIRMDAPEARCDLRGYRGYVWGSGYVFRLTETELINEGSAYLNYHRS